MIDKPVSGRRISLNVEASRLLQDEINKIKKSKRYIKVNENKLTSRIVTFFFQHFYEKEQEEVLGPFFDKKAYLTEIIKNSESDEAMLASMKKYLKKTKNRKTI